MKERLKTIKTEVSNGKKPGRGDILWCRGIKMTAQNKPIDLRVVGGADIPSAFFDMVKGITKRGNGDFTLNLKNGVSYYKLGCLMAK